MKGLPFVVRVYGVYIDAEKGLLVSDEYIKGKYITKFPGGGLEFGEGTISCLKREMREETGCEFEVMEHFYTTDFFVASVFDPFYQVLSIYYKIKPSSTFNLAFTNEPFRFQQITEGAQAFRFIPLVDLKKEMLTLEIDRRVAELVLQKVQV